MDIKSALQEALKTGRKALTEFQAKQLLKQYAIPVVSEAVATTADEAVRLADEMGYPVVLKGMGTNLLHKTERGLMP